MSQHGSYQWPAWQELAGGNHRLMNILRYDRRKRRQILTWLSIILLVLLLNGIFFTRVFPFMNGALASSSLPLDVVKANGTLLSQTYNLSFRSSGSVISEIDVKPGQQVTAGQVLARLDPTPYLNDLHLAQVRISAGQNQLNAALAKMRERLAEREARLNAAIAALRVAQAEQAAINRQAAALVNQARVTLASDQAVLHQTIQTANSQVTTAAVQRQQSLLNCEALVIPTNTITHTVTATASKSATTTKSAPTATPTTSRTANASKTATASETSTLTSHPPHSFSTCVALANAQFTQTVNSAHLTVTSSLATVNKDIATVTLAVAQAAVNVITARGNVIINQTNIPVAYTTGHLGDAILDVGVAQGILAIAIAQLPAAQYALAGATLVAPHSGIVTAVNGTVGSPPGSGSPVVQLTGTDTQQAQVNVSETDITKVKVGQSVQLTLKAYGNQQFTGKVSAILPKGTSSSSGTSYPVIVDLDPNSVDNTQLLSGMSTSATITTGGDSNN